MSWNLSNEDTSSHYMCTPLASCKLLNAYTNILLANQQSFGSPAGGLITETENYLVYTLYMYFICQYYKYIVVHLKKMSYKFDCTQVAIKFVKK